MTAAKGKGTKSGSGFISRDNDDPTAEAAWGFMKKAEIPREKSILWNVIPWWNGTRAVTNAELEDGARCVVELLLILLKIKAVMFVGKKAAEAKPYICVDSVELFTSAHPSPLVRAHSREKWDMIPTEWGKIAAHLTVAETNDGIKHDE